MLPPVEKAVNSSNPKFEALYNDLCNNKLNIDGTSKLDAKAQKERDGLSEELRKARVDTAKSSLITSGLRDLSYRPGSLPEDLRELVAVIAALLEGQIAEEDRDLLRDDLVKFKQNIKPISTALSKSFQQDANTLAAIIDPDSPPPIDNLPGRITDLRTSIATSKATALHSRLELAQEVSSLHSTYRQAIETSIRILEQTIHGSVARSTKAKADYLALVAEGMSKKLSLQHGQLISQLYSAEIQEALRLKAEEVEQQSRTTKRKVRQAEEKLEEYRKAGGGVKGMAMEYAEISEESERVKGEVARLQDGKR
ncbi:hypothetical protein LTR37_018109 [Vermiconidia calcicola]|uniref:Uncharacterized protein n=1 Tax=Vermiconidia calcicola TaxID=1690605 RepID=A0ACC3MJP0_9PEZI|nr:hypothetical protein LTR37_018109 [Vermiconidia calcicola]